MESKRLSERETEKVRETEGLLSQQDQTSVRLKRLTDTK